MCLSSFLLSLYPSLTHPVQIPFNNYIPYPEDSKPELDFRRAPGQLKGIESWEKIALTAVCFSLF